MVNKSIEKECAPNLKIKKDKSKNSRRGEVIFDVVLYFLVSLLCLIMLYPFVYMVSASFSSREMIEYVILLPKGFNINAYRYVFSYKYTFTGYANTFLYTLVGTGFSLVLTLLAAYPLSKGWLPGRKIMVFFVLVTMYFSGGLIPEYIINRNILGLYNNLWVMVLPGALNTYFAMIAISFIHQLPGDLDEAARIDGAGEWQVFLKVTLPLLSPIIVTLALFYAVGMWNSWLQGFIYLSDESKYPLQLILKNLMSSFSIDTGNIGIDVPGGQVDPTAFSYAMTVAIILPIIFIYPFLQKYFEKGLLVGSLKG